MTRQRPHRSWSKCLACGISTQSAISVCRACQQQTSTDERQRSACTTCGRTCRSASGLCAACLHPSTTPLAGGRWVAVGGIQRWRPWTSEECAERTLKALQSLPVDNRSNRPMRPGFGAADSQQEESIGRAA